MNPLRRALRLACRAACASGVAALAACSSRAAAQPPAIPYPPPARSSPAPTGDFPRAVSSLNEQVQLLLAAPASVDDAALNRALRTLAAALQAVPDTQGVDVTAAAQTVRTPLPLSFAGTQPPPATQQLYDALESAAGAMLLLAHGPYVRFPFVADDVSGFERSVNAIERDQRIAAQPRQVVGALAMAGRALSAFERASGLAAAPVVRAPAGTPAAAGPAAPPRGREMGVAEGQTVPAPSLPFPAALTSYSTFVDRYASLPPDGAARALRRAIDAIAAALEVMPRGQGLAPSEDAVALRRLGQEFELARPLSTDQARIARDAFSRTWTFFRVAAEKAYRGAPAVGDAVRALHEQYVTIDPSRPLRAQLLPVLGSLDAVERVLRTMAQVAAG